VPLTLLTVFYLILLVVRRTVLVWVLLAGILIASFIFNPGPRSDHSMIHILATLIASGTLILILTRYRILACSGYFLIQHLTDRTMLTLDASAWYFWHSAVVTAVLFALAGFTFYTATAGGRLFHGGFFGDD